MRILVIGLLTAALLSGCTTGNHKTAYRIKQLKEADTVAVVTTDALQRSVVIRKTNYSFQFCAEKFPDAFSVLAASHSLNLGADVKAQSGNLGLSQSFNETGTAIQRTQAANLLAESLYRTCERFMNGQIDQAAAAEQATRDANNIVAVLAIEQLTSMGRVEPRIVISGGGASIGGGAIEVLAAQREKLTAAKAARSAADAEATEILAGAASCDAIADNDKKAACTAGKPELDRKLDASKNLWCVEA